MEFERVKYVLKSYLRTRLTKIERHLLYIVEKDCSSLLSEHETLYAFQLYDNRKTYFNETFGDKIPQKLNPLASDKEQLDEKLSKYLSFTNFC